MKRRLGVQPGRSSLPNPTDFGILSRNRRWGGVWDADDDRSDDNVGNRNAESVLAFRRIEPSLRQSNPTRTKPHAVSREHEILRRQSTILGYPRASLNRRDHDQNGRVVKYMEIRIG